MSRTVAQLQKEAAEVGIEFGGKNVDLMRDILAQYYWEKENPGVLMPLQVPVMLARDASKLTKEEFAKMFDNSNWIAEHKLNGCRGSLILEVGKVPRITSRRRSDEHHRFEEKAGNVPHLRDYCWFFTGLTVLDGELEHDFDSIVTSEGTITKNKLQTACAMLNSEPAKGLAMQQKYGNLHYVVWDVQWINGRDLRNEPLWYRYSELQKFLDDQRGANIKLADRWTYQDAAEEGGFYALYEKLVKEGKEGIMLKDIRGIYRTIGRPKTMWKMKESVTFDAFISGFVPATVGKGFENYIGAFEVSAFIDGVERAIGSISSIDLETRKDATKYAMSIVVTDPASMTDMMLEGSVPVLNPKYLGRCMEIKGQSVSKNGRINHCEMIQWRPDKSPSDCQILGSLYYGRIEQES